MPKFRRLEGNQSELSRKHKVEPAFQTLAITQEKTRIGATPVVSDQNVEQAKHFVDENKK